MPDLNDEHRFAFDGEKDTVLMRLPPIQQVSYVLGKQIGLGGYRAPLRKVSSESMAS